MSNVLKIAAAGGVTGEETDEHFENTVLLLHGDGNQGATNFSNTGSPSYLAFKDNSTNNFPITVNGDAYGDNFGPFAVADGNWSNYFDGTGDYLRCDEALDGFTNASDPFTVEAWFYTLVSPAIFEVVIGINTSNGATNQLLLGVESGQLSIHYAGAAKVLVSTVTINTWNHVAGVFDGTDFKVYLNGSLVHTVSSTSPTTSLSGCLFVIGAEADSGPTFDNFFEGYISNVRVVESAVYTSAFTPSTTPLTAISGTSLLTCQSNRFVDNSTNNFAITRNGDVKVQVFNPFDVLPDGVNGSGFFDNSGDSLQVQASTAMNFGSGDFTVEFFVYHLTLGTDTYFDTRLTSAGIHCFVESNGRIYFDIKDAADGLTQRITSSIGAVTTNNWNHVAICRNSGTTTIYVNGVSKGSAADSNTYTSASNRPYIGDQYTGSSVVHGYMSNFRVVKSAVYTSAFTPPTSALTAVTNTSLLTCQYAGSVRNVGFIDSGPYDFPITRVGNTTQGTFSPFSKPDGAWGNYFDGSGDYLEMSDNASFQFGANNWTVEFWAYATSALTTNYIISQFSTGNKGIIFGTGAQVSGKISYLVSTTGSNDIPVNDPDTFPINQWVHVAGVRTGDLLALFVNGTRKGTYSLSAGASLYNSTNLIRICAHSDGSASTFFPGYISNLRSVIGANSPYDATQSTITIPTAPLTAITNTSLLTCQSNRFIDNSSNNFTITRNGDVKVTPFSPFPITTAYDPSVNGGSGYFDGTGDYLDIASSSAFALGTADSCIEMWVYSTAMTNYRQLFTGRTTVNSGDNVAHQNNDGKINWYQSGFNVEAPAGSLLPNSWNHLAFVVRSGLRYIYVNGVQKVSSPPSAQNVTSENFRIGATTTPNEYYSGYMTSVRVVKGNSVYSSNFTPPTAPLTAISGTSLLCNFTNAGILDNTGFNALETVDNAQIDTSVVKYGTGAMKFDGTGDYLNIPSSDALAPRTGDFTVEGWVYFLNFTSGYPQFYSIGTGSPAWQMAFTSTTMYIWNGSSNIISSSFTWATNTWYHIAFTRSAGTIRLFVDGTQIGSVASSFDFTQGSINIGGYQNGLSNGAFAGYMDDVRITKGIARYTTTFTPPDKSLPDIGE